MCYLVNFTVDAGNDHHPPQWPKLKIAITQKRLEIISKNFFKLQVFLSSTIYIETINIQSSGYKAWLIIHGMTLIGCDRF